MTVPLSMNADSEPVARLGTVPVDQLLAVFHVPGEPSQVGMPWPGLWNR